MPEPVLRILTLCFVALLYLFFFRVLRAVWAELKAPSPAAGVPGRPPPPPPPAASTTPAPAPSRAGSGTPVELRVVAPGGQRFPIVGEMTIGRGDGCAVRLADPTVSTLHARIARRGGGCVAEDLGSRNGTFLNGQPLTAAAPVSVGDRLRCGRVELEVL